jgi:hypothetical protein
MRPAKTIRAMKMYDRERRLPRPVPVVIKPTAVMPKVEKEEVVEEKMTFKTKIKEKFSGKTKKRNR